jgi:hypothetical protein
VKQKGTLKDNKSLEHKINRKFKDISSADKNKLKISL